MKTYLSFMFDDFTTDMIISVSRIIENRNLVLFSMKQVLQHTSVNS